MNIFRLALELFVLYILYKLVVDFIIPIYRATKQMKGTMNKMQEQMQQQQRQQQSNFNTVPPREPKKNHSEDYIDFEEVK
jgi:hypothetical protein